MLEDRVDDHLRSEILSKLANPIIEGKPAPAVIKNNLTVDQTTVPQTLTSKKVCINCNHRIWFDGEEWQHSGADHNLNCSCRIAQEGNTTPTEVQHTTTPTATYTSYTPSDILLKDVVQLKLDEQKREESEAELQDTRRKEIIKKINERSSDILKNWRF